MILFNNVPYDNSLIHTTREPKFIKNIDFYQEVEDIGKTKKRIKTHENIKIGFLPYIEASIKIKLLNKDKIISQSNTFTDLHLYNSEYIFIPLSKYLINELKDFKDIKNLEYLLDINKLFVPVVLSNKVNENQIFKDNHINQKEESKLYYSLPKNVILENIPEEQNNITISPSLNFEEVKEQMLKALN